MIAGSTQALRAFRLRSLTLSESALYRAQPSALDPLHASRGMTVGRDHFLSG